MYETNTTTDKKMNLSVTLQRFLVTSPSPPAISLSQHQVTLLILIQRNKLCNVERDLSTSFYRRGSGNSKRLGEKLKFGLK